MKKKIEISNIRNEEILKHIIITYIKPENVGVPDGWSGLKLFIKT